VLRCDGLGASVAQLFLVVRKARWFGFGNALGFLELFRAACLTPPPKVRPYFRDLGIDPTGPFAT
jgi:hypothetical protein